MYMYTTTEPYSKSSYMYVHYMSINKVGSVVDEWPAGATKKSADESNYDKSIVLDSKFVVVNLYQETQCQSNVIFVRRQILKLNCACCHCKLNYWTRTRSSQLEYGRSCTMSRRRYVTTPATLSLNLMTIKTEACRKMPTLLFRDYNNGNKVPN